MKLLEENIRETLYDIDVGKELLQKTPEARVTKAKIGNWNDMKVTTFFTAKKTLSKVQKQSKG